MNLAIRVVTCSLVHRIQCTPECSQLICISDAPIPLLPANPIPIYFILKLANTNTLPLYYLHLKGQCNVLKPCNILCNMKSCYSVFLCLCLYFTSCNINLDKSGQAFRGFCLPKHAACKQPTSPVSNLISLLFIMAITVSSLKALLMDYYPFICTNN